MKKFALLALVCFLTACSFSPNVNWEQGNLAELAHIDVELKSNLWTDLLPNADKSAQTRNLNGTLTLTTSGELPADLTVKQIVLKQGKDFWVINGDDVELRTQSENVWEVVFQTEIALHLNKTVAVALELLDSDGDVWLVERKVDIDRVY
ncbi:hypothetical protein LDJ79_12175 [Vibrio tritonius]|uniref:DNA polymerase III subunit beta n=1 Tax=Vibrio tritonius TaxID=1435069 RepID=A0ABS7YP81_9VIBR|nr:hypothetical protein [Vibrio tritonius]MCA2016872.1 hypothetical protein [Vibrio tritonius]